MGQESMLLQLLPFVIWTIIALPPSVRLLRRVGIHPALAAFNLMPLLGTVILVWIVAYSKWPKAPPIPIPPPG